MANLATWQIWSIKKDGISFAKSVAWCNFQKLIFKTLLKKNLFLKIDSKLHPLRFFLAIVSIACLVCFSRLWRKNTTITLTILSQKPVLTGPKSMNFDYFLDQLNFLQAALLHSYWKLGLLNKLISKVCTGVKNFLYAWILLTLLTLDSFQLPVFPLVESKKLKKPERVWEKKSRNDSIDQII